MGRQGILTVLLFLVALITTETDAGKYLFHLPWACSVLHDSGSLVGACAILNAGNVLVSVDNFNQWVPTSSNRRRYFEVLDELSVWAGTNYLNPSKLDKKPHFAQHRKVDNLFIGTSHRHSATEFGDKWEYIEKPIRDIDGRVPQDLFGVAFNVGILKLHKRPFLWTAYVRPISINTRPAIKSETENFLTFLASYNSLATRISDNMCVTYSWNEALNKIRYHQVSYLPNEYCLDAFCGWNLSACDRFPSKKHLVCFKATKFSDVCPNARGAALYCPTWGQSVFAILTSAPSCGLRHMPGVYTTLPLAISLYESVYKVDFLQEAEVPLDDPFSLEQKDADYEGIS